MAKKSAKSKGFRKQTAKKPYLSKKEIIALCAIIAVLIVGAILLFRYDDGALKLQDGAVVADGDNWLIVNGAASARSRARYFKLGEAGEIDGYTRELANGIADDPNVPRYAFTPEAEDADIDRIEMTATHATADTMAKYASAALAATDGFEVSEIAQAGEDGAKWSYFIATGAYYQAETAEAAGEAAETDATEAAGEAADTDADAAEAETAGETADATETEVAEGTADATEAETAEETADAAEADTEAADADEADETPEPNRFEKALYAYLDAAHDSCIIIHVNAAAPSADEYVADDVLIAGAEQAIAAITLEK